MSNKTDKSLSDRDASQILQMAGNETDATLSVSGFISAKVGNKVTRTVISSTIDDYSFYVNSSTLLYTIRITYNNSGHDEMDSTERTA